MSTQRASAPAASRHAPPYARILVALDASDHANRAVVEAAELASMSAGTVTGVHAYAARLHDLRFRQMEGGLPEQFREEQELERQRDVHDDLIGRGLSIITDSYLDQAERTCARAGVGFARRSLEGKNYRALLEELERGDYDLLVLGALGVGAIAGSRLGTVCARVVRRTPIDTLVIKDPGQRIGAGPIVVAVDGSPRAYGALGAALALASRWAVPVHVVAAFDPYFHYVAFNRIAGVLSEEAGKVFRFQEQERLHEEIIDSGLAKIYRGHLEVARSIAAGHGIEFETALLDGKPHDAIARYLKKVSPSLLVLGKLGVHADPGLDIGGNAEQLLHDADCAVLLGQRERPPPPELLAEVTTSWTREAEQRLERAPSFVRAMARMAILRYAQERGHTVITERLVEEATAELMPGHAGQAMAAIVAARDAADRGAGRGLPWSPPAGALLERVADPALRANLRLRAEKRARQQRAARVEREHLEPFLGGGTGEAPGGEGRAPRWEAAALARLMRVPEGFMRDAARRRIERAASERGAVAVDVELVEAVLAAARREMEERQAGPAAAGARCPVPGGGPEARGEGAARRWSAGALRRLAEVPAGRCREMTRRAAEARAGGGAVEEATVEAVIRAVTGTAGEAACREHAGARASPPGAEGER